MGHCPCAASAAHQAWSLNAQGLCCAVQEHANKAGRLGAEESYRAARACGAACAGSKRELWGGRQPGGCLGLESKCCASCVHLCFGRLCSVHGNLQRARRAPSQVPQVACQYIVKPFNACVLSYADAYVLSYAERQPPELALACRA